MTTIDATMNGRIGAIDQELAELAAQGAELNGKIATATAAVNADVRAQRDKGELRHPSGRLVEQRDKLHVSAVWTQSRQNELRLERGQIQAQARHQLARVREIEAQIAALLPIWDQLEAFRAGAGAVADVLNTTPALARYRHEVQRCWILFSDLDSWTRELETRRAVLRDLGMPDDA